MNLRAHMVNAVAGAAPPIGGGGVGHAHPTIPPSRPQLFGVGSGHEKKYNSTCARREEFVLTFRLNYGYWSAILFSYVKFVMRRFSKMVKQKSLLKLLERKAIKVSLKRS